MKKTKAEESTPIPSTDEIRVLFLDVDGVLNHEGLDEMVERKVRKGLIVPDYVNNPLESRTETQICELAVSNLQCICENVPNLRIVMSSTWRLHFKEEDFKKIFALKGFDDAPVIGLTPRYVRMSSDRPAEIRQWLEDWAEDPKNPKVVDYMILDDHIVGNFKDQFKLISSVTGLTYRETVEVIEYFVPDWKQPIRLY